MRNERFIMLKKGKKQNRKTWLLALLFVIGSSFTAAAASSDNAMDVSIIGDFYFLNRNIIDEKIKDARILNYMEYKNTGGVNARGFNLRYGEIAAGGSTRAGFSFYGDAVLTPEGARIEELYFKYAIMDGLFVKAGRFLTTFGNSNTKHYHKKPFFDQALFYWALYGNQGLLENGVGIFWKAIIGVELTIGFEVLEGKNELTYGTEQFGSNNQKIGSTTMPNLLNGFINAKIPMGNLKINFGFYAQRGGSRINNDLQSNSGSAIHGMTMAMIGSLSVKYYFDSYRFISIGGEFMFRNTSGDYFEGISQVTYAASYDRTNSGYYGQILGKPIPWILCGVRFGGITGEETIGSIIASGEEGDSVLKTERTTPGTPEYFRISAMSQLIINNYFRVRLQYNFDQAQSQINDAGEQIFYPKLVEHTVILQAEFSYGTFEKFSYSQ